MASPADRRYADSHEWHLLDDDILTLGISKFAVDELADVTYIEMKSAGTRVNPGDSVGEVESVKATSEIYTSVGGEIIEVNSELSDDPSVLNSDPYDQGWLCKIRVTDRSELDSLMDAATYDQKYST